MPVAKKVAEKVAKKVAKPKKVVEPAMPVVEAPTPVVEPVKESNNGSADLKTSRDKTQRDRVVSLPKLNDKPDALSAIQIMSEGLELVYSCLSDIDSGEMSKEDQKIAVYEMYAEMMSLLSDSKALLTSFRRYYKVKEKDVLLWLQSLPPDEEEDDDEDSKENDKEDSKEDTTLPSVLDQIPSAKSCTDELIVASREAVKVNKERKKRNTKVNYDHSKSPENAAKIPSIDEQIATLNQNS